MSPLFLYPRGLCLVTPSPTLLSPEQQFSPPAQLSPSPPLSVTLLLFIVFTNSAAGSALKEMAPAMSSPPPGDTCLVQGCSCPAHHEAAYILPGLRLSKAASGSPVGAVRVVRGRDCAAGPQACNAEHILREGACPGPQRFPTYRRDPHSRLYRRGHSVPLRDPSQQQVTRSLAVIKIIPHPSTSDLTSSIFPRGVSSRLGL